ncbi:comm domain-containing protein [Anaeramoeba flamelloides]|uniref:Comm domain-containing protein n=1 Tax=Anaeramoeba flamelloides TaxID=1746091 RepID=A0AAV7YP80_9EUKA|nr:comm domain-containing protein [Anaeramoeba flamelloides]KAJ6249307.1 comm domain-containing protein [Anaeramoeba flamelloides]
MSIPLLSLLKAPSPKYITDLIDQFFFARLEASSIPNKEQIIKELEINENKFYELQVSVYDLINDSLYHNLKTSEKIEKQLFPQKFHGKLRSLLSSHISTSLEKWHKLCKSKYLTLPKLISFDWRVDVKSASDLTSTLSAPVVLLEMKVQEPPEFVGLMPKIKTVNVELTKERLQTMLDGLVRINEQLVSVTNK